MDMRAAITFAMLVLAVMVGFLTVAVAQPSLPPAPAAPVYRAAQQPPQQGYDAIRPNGPYGPVAAPGTSGLYNVLNYGRNGARCTPSPLVPTACR